MNFKIMEMAAENTKAYKGVSIVKPKIKVKGKEIDVDAMIQAAREDTEIYPTLEKYGCLDRIKRDDEGIYADLTEVKDLRGSLEQLDAAETMWRNLPLEVREEFNNNVHEFMDTGMERIKKKIDAKKAEQEKAIKEAETPIKEGDANVQ